MPVFLSQIMVNWCDCSESDKSATKPLGPETPFPYVTYMSGRPSKQLSPCSRDPLIKYPPRRRRRRQLRRRNPLSPSLSGAYSRNEERAIPSPLKTWMRGKKSRRAWNSFCHKKGENPMNWKVVEWSNPRPESSGAEGELIPSDWRACPMGGGGEEETRIRGWWCQTLLSDAVFLGFYHHNWTRAFLPVKD